MILVPLFFLYVVVTRFFCSWMPVERIAWHGSPL